jgi:hypothetical protein
MAEPFNPALYVRAPVININNGVTLCKALVDACPKGAPANVLKARKKLDTTADAAATALTARRRKLGTVSDEEARDLDQEADGAFGALRMRLQAYALLPVERYPLAKDAAEITVRLFGDEGLNFLSFAYNAQNTAMASVLRLIDEDKLEKTINTIVGPEFLEQIRDVLPRYDAMAKARMSSVDGDTNLMEHVRAMQAAIVDYANKVSGMVDEDDPATVEAVQRALRPIDAHREAVARAAQGGEPAREDDAPPAGQPGAGGEPKPST